MSCFILAYPEITPHEPSFVDWMITEFIPQTVWEKLITKSWPEEESKEPQRNQIIKNVFQPVVSLTEHEDKLCPILNKITGMNRFMTLDHRVKKLKLRFQFLDHALMQLHSIQQSLI